MTITLEKAWKNYESEWVFKNLSHQFTQGNSYALLGPNGSGKSTLLQVLAGSVSLSKGTISYQHNGVDIGVESIYQHLGFSSPYLQLMEEFTLMEQLQFHQRFRPFIGNLQPKQLVEILYMQPHADKHIRKFSSGMKQRVKLALSILGQSQVVFLDEPATNLDDKGIRWFRDLLDTHLQNRLLIVSANRPEEYEFCQHSLNMMDYK